MYDVIKHNYKILEARFVNSNHDLIRYVWADADGVERSDFITFNTKEDIIQHILKHFSVEQMIENFNVFAAEEIRFTSKLREFVEKDAKDRGINIELTPLTKNTTENLESNLLADLLNVNKVNDPEELFKFKLSVFDRPSIKESTNRELKGKIRKATSAIEVLYHFYPVFEEYHANLENVQTEPQDEIDLDDNIPQDTSNLPEQQSPETDDSSKTQPTLEEHM